jgi:CBS domain-containing protein
MRVREVMSSKVESCSPDTNLAEAAMIMWRCDCGIVPVVEPGTQRIVGTVTDRDVCMALATTGQRPTERTAKEVMARSLATVDADDDVRVALERMEETRVRRLPVLGDDGTLAGMLSINDLVLATDRDRTDGHPLPAEAVMKTLRAISEHRKLEPVGQEAGIRDANARPADGARERRPREREPRNRVQKY